ncbi:MAG: tRNA pseudouridine(38-40) synthase TruA [Gallionella sp.]
MRVVLGIEYDGRPYCGWQSQANGQTLQDALQDALGQLTGESISVVAAGRTDTGVHALEQVIHFDTRAERPLTAWVRGVNSFLPESIVVKWAQPVDEEFHARFSARGRSYRYLLNNRNTRPALNIGRVGWFHAPLDEHAMAAAARFLLGEHDFSAFRAAQCQARSPVKHIYNLDIHRQGQMLIIDISANAFLHHMVRNIVGCLVYVGKGKYPPEWLAEVVAGRDRSLAAPTFAPDGLYLRHINYESKWSLPQLDIPGASGIML